MTYFPAPLTLLSVAQTSLFRSTLQAANGLPANASLALEFTAFTESELSLSLSLSLSPPPPPPPPPLSLSFFLF